MGPQHLAPLSERGRPPRSRARTLTERQLNRALLARQLLLDRSNIALPRALERIGGLQTQYAPSAYVGSWSRLSGFDRAALTTALERSSVVQATLMRATIHMVSRRDYWPIALAVREPRREWWLAATRHVYDSRAMKMTADRVRDLLGDEPKQRGEIVSTLGLDAQTWNGVGLWVDLVRVAPSGTWEQRRADLYGLAERHVGPVPPGLTADDGRELLVRRYLVAFGPASRKDVASFTGLPGGPLKPVFERLTLRRFLDEQGGELVDIARGPLPDPATPAPVRFLPTWDASLLVHARRTQIVPEPVRALIFNTKTPHSVATFLVDGQVAGTWRHDDGRVMSNRSTACRHRSLLKCATRPSGSKRSCGSRADRFSLALLRPKGNRYPRRTHPFSCRSGPRHPAACSSDASSWARSP